MPLAAGSLSSGTYVGNTRAPNISLKPFPVPIRTATPTMALRVLEWARTEKNWMNQISHLYRPIQTVESMTWHIQVEHNANDSWQKLLCWNMSLTYSTQRSATNSYEEERFIVPSDEGSNKWYNCSGEYINSSLARYHESYFDLAQSIFGQNKRCQEYRIYVSKICASHAQH